MNLHPHIQGLLYKFETRRRRLLCVRAFLTALIALFIFTVSAAALDGPLLLEDRTRVAAAALVYTAAFAAVWLRAGALLSRPRTQQKIAEAIEHSEPTLKGSLLSAVELSGPVGISGDSAALRELHQARTASAITTLDCTRLLPWKKIQWDILAASVVALFLLLGLLLGGPRFARSCARILLPFAPLERSSETLIIVVSPSPNEGVVPAGERLAVSVEIQGRPALKPTLDVPSGNKTEKSTPMNALGPNRFQADLDILDAPIDYRVRAGDGATKLFHLLPAPRPRVLSFTRVYHPPAYTGLPELTETSADGSIGAVEGTLVDLSFKTNQAIATGTLKFSSGQIHEEVVLSKDPSDQTVLHARLLLKQNGVYSLRLVSSTTNFDSAKSADHEVRVDLDLPPTLTLETPVQDLVLPLGDKLEFTGTVDDDFGIASLAQETSLNRGPWRALPPTAPAAKHLDLRTLWDPLEQHPKAGDTIAVRFVALDNKGQRSESRVIQVSFAPRGLSPAIPPALAAQRAITRRVEEVSRQANDAAKALQEARAENEARSPNILKQNQALARAKQALDSAAENAAAAREQVLTQIRNESDLSALSNLKNQAQALNRIELGELALARQALNRLSSTTQETKPEASDIEVLKHAAEASAKGASLANSTRDAAQTRLAAMEAESLAAEARALAAEQTAIAAAADQPAPSADGPSKDAITEALRRQQVNQSATTALQKELQTLSERSPAAAPKLKSVRSTLQNDQQNADRLLNAAQAEIATGKEAESAPKAVAAGKALSKSLDQTAEALDTLAPTLQEAAVKALQRLQTENNRNAEHIAQTSRELEVLEKKKDLSPSDKSALASERLNSEAAVLRADARVEAARRNASPQMDHDLRTAAAALEAGAENGAPPSEMRAKAAATALALQTLEAVASLDEARKNTESLAQKSAAEEPMPKALSPQQKMPPQHKALSEQLQKLPPEVRRAGLPEEAAAAATTAQNALLKQTQEGLEEAGKALKQSSEAATEAAQKARASLKSLAPPLATRLDALAQKSQKAAEVTRELNAAKNASAPPVPEKVLQAEEKFGRQLDQLQQELQADASRQDSMTPEGRASARDADAAAAQLKDSGKTLASLNEANASRTEAAKALERAADQQSQTSKQLQQLAEHFRNLESGSPEQIAASRQNLRNSEQQTGTRTTAEKRESGAAEMAALAATPAEQAQAKLEALLGAQKNSPEHPASTPANDSQKALNNALEALKSGRTEAATKAISAAVDSHMEADRLARNSEESDSANSSVGKPNAPASNSIGLPLVTKSGDANWGNLPKRLATDLMEGKRERPPSEYRASIDAYFQAVAEKARGIKPSR